MANGEDPIAADLFQGENDGGMGAQFKEISGGTDEGQVIESIQNKTGGINEMVKLPGTHKWGDITLKKGKTGDMGLWNWAKQAHSGDVAGARRNFSIVCYDTQHAEVSRLNFLNGWPSKVGLATMSADGNDILL